MTQILPYKEFSVQYFINGPIQTEQFRTFVEFVHCNVADACPQLDVLIQSSGGSVSVALAFAEFLLTLPCLVRTSNIGNVDSASVLLFSAGGKRFCSPYSGFLLHPVGKEVSGVRTAIELRNLANEIDEDMKRTTEFLEMRTGTPAHIWLEMMTQTTQLQAHKAQSLGLVTSIESIPLTPSCIRV